MAAKDLEVGDLVFEEKAFLKLPSKATLSFYKTELSRLEPDIQAKLINLSYAENENLSNLDESAILLKKFNSNCFEVEDNNALVQEAAVFEMLSMINHSCKSNVMYFSEEADKTKIKVHVCRRIKEGEEIVLSYISRPASHSGNRGGKS